MTSYYYNGNNAKFKIAIGVLIYENIRCVSFMFVIFVPNGVVEIFQFIKLSVISVKFLDDIRKIVFTSLAYLIKQVLFSEFVANIGPEFLSILAYMVRILGVSLPETIASLKNEHLRFYVMDMLHHVVKAKANIQANLFFRFQQQIYHL